MQSFVIENDGEFINVQITFVTKKDSSIITCVGELQCMNNNITLYAKGNGFSFSEAHRIMLDQIPTALVTLKILTQKR